MILLKRSVVLILISVFVINTAGIVVYTYIPKYLLHLGTEEPLMQLIITIFPLTAFVVPPLYGFFSDKIQKRFVFLVFGTIGINLSYFFLFLAQELLFIVIVLLDGAYFPLFMRFQPPPVFSLSAGL